MGATLLVARRELRLLSRSRGTLGVLALLAAVAWLPVLLLPLRQGTLGVASFAEMLPLQIALAEVILPLLALLAGAEMFAGELEDGTLVTTVTLPISRRACFAGKSLGRGAALCLGYLAMFAGAGAVVALTRGGRNGPDWAAVTGAGLLLCLSTGGLGAWLGAGGSGRVRAFGAALGAWVVLTFALDAVLLTAVVALAPPPPGTIGEHGHGEVAPPRAQTPDHDPHAREAEPEAPAAGALSGWLMTASPVSLFRLTSLAAGPSLRPRLGLALPGGAGAGLWVAVVVGWLGWLGAPLALGLRRFQRVNLG